MDPTGQVDLSPSVAPEPDGDVLELDRQRLRIFHAVELAVTTGHEGYVLMLDEAQVIRDASEPILTW